MHRDQRGADAAIYSPHNPRCSRASGSSIGMDDRGAELTSLRERSWRLGRQRHTAVCAGAPARRGGPLADIGGVARILGTRSVSRSRMQRARLVGAMSRKVHPRRSCSRRHRPKSVETAANLAGSGPHIAATGRSSPNTGRHRGDSEPTLAEIGRLDRPRSVEIAPNLVASGANQAQVRAMSDKFRTISAGFGAGAARLGPISIRPNSAAVTHAVANSVWDSRRVEEGGSENKPEPRGGRLKI